jgi:phage anti-repressor protein
MQNLKGIYIENLTILLNYINSENNSFIVIRTETIEKNLLDKTEKIIILDAPKEVISIQRKER